MLKKIQKTVHGWCDGDWVNITDLIGPVFLLILLMLGFGAFISKFIF